MGSKGQKSSTFSSYSASVCRFRLTRLLTNKKQLPHNKRFSCNRNSDLSNHYTGIAVANEVQIDTASEM